MNGIKAIADSINSELKRRLPNQRKTQRTKLALLVALPREADRTGPLGNAKRYMRYNGSPGCSTIPW